MKGHEMEMEGIGKVRRIRTTTAKRRGRTERPRKQKVPEQVLNTWMIAIKEWQLQDPDLKQVSMWTERPGWAEISRERPELKYYWSRWEQLKQEDGIWYYRWKDGSGSIIWKVIIPPTGQAAILQEHHNNRIAGHFGLEKTLNRLRQSPYFWPKLRETVEKWCRECHLCTRTKSSNLKTRAPMQNIGTGATLERVGIDILGHCLRRKEATDSS